jgi:Rieske Fe-S protein
VACRRFHLPVIDRRGALGTLAGAVVVACSGDSSGDDAAGTDGGDEGGDETVDCSGTAGSDVGPETSFAQGTWTLVQTYIVAQDANGFFAYSAICTHQGCLVQPPASDGSTVCFCHGSQFDGNGNVTLGPAFQPLQHYAVNICGGEVFVDQSTPVSKSTRTPPQ